MSVMLYTIQCKAGHNFMKTLWRKKLEHEGLRLTSSLSNNAESISKEVAPSLWNFVGRGNSHLPGPSQPESTRSESWECR